MSDESTDLTDEIAALIRASDIGGWGSTVDAGEAAENIAAFLCTHAVPCLPISEVQRIRVEPGEVLAFRMSESVSMEEKHRVGEQLHRALPGVQIVVYAAGEFTVIAADEAQQS